MRPATINSSHAATKNRQSEIKNIKKKKDCKGRTKTSTQVRHDYVENYNSFPKKLLDQMIEND